MPTAPSARTAAAATLGAAAAYAVYVCYHRYWKPRYNPWATVTRRFHRDGIVVVRGFASASECREMLASMDALVEEWDPAETTSVFKTDASQSAAQGKDDYFMTSGDAVRFFLEPGAMDEASGALLAPKQEALNKVGHALHVYEPVFARYAQSAKVRALVRSLGWQAPDLVQSMYIFKQPRIGRSGRFNPSPNPRSGRFNPSPNPRSSRVNPNPNANPNANPNPNPNPNPNRAPRAAR